MQTCLASVLLWVVPAAWAAQEPHLIATYASWSVYDLAENSNQVCYMLSQATGAAGHDQPERSKPGRGKVYALITNRPADGSRNVFNYIAGYPYKPGSSVSLSIDGETFSLFTQDDTAWAPDAATDEKIAQAMAKGSSMTVRGMSSRDRSTADIFSLDGFAAAHRTLSRQCAGH